jgi:general secretion pathway protein D
VGFPAIIDTSSSVVGIGHLMENYNVTQLELPLVQAILEALETDADAKILQEPQVTTFNNVEASVMIGTSIPILVPQGQGSVFGTNPYTYETQDINISLSVTPRVNEEGYISIKLNTSVQAIVALVGPEGDRPQTSNRTVNTNVMVKDGETLLIGGLIFENNTHSRSQFPILGNIPLLNVLFKSKVDDVEQRELLIFITPSVVG